MGLDWGWADVTYDRLYPNGNARIEAPVKRLIELLQKRFNLTGKEAEIAARLIANDRQSEIVTALNISLNTFKTHRKRIYEKIGVNRQIDLVARGEALRNMANREF